MRFLLQALAGAALLLLTAGCAREQAGIRGIILVTVDTLRSDAPGYAGGGARTPFLDRVAAEGLAFVNAHAHNVVTLPSHANIVTGLYPYQHGIRDNSGFTLSRDHPTLGTILKEAGWATGAFVGAYPLDSRYGLDAGFDVYDDQVREGSTPLDFSVPERSAGEVLSAAASWWRANSGRKRFLWIHVYDPHAPYLPPSPFREEYAADPYLGEVAWTDHALGQWITPMLEEEGTALVLTSDHGEALGDHGELTHGLFAYEATLAVPLLVRAPGITPARDERYVRHVDIAPTILELAAVSFPGLPGASLLSGEGDRDTYFESLSSMLNRGWAPLAGIIHARSKYIDLPLPELYDLTNDPAESNNLYPEERRTVAALRKLLADAAPSRQAGEREVSAEESAKLLSLGYLAGVAGEKEFTEADDPKNLVEVDAKIHRSVEAYQRGDLDRAIALAREVSESREDMNVGREMLAFLLQQKERPEAAIATLGEAVQRGTASEAMRVRYGLMLSENGRAAEALVVLEPLAAGSDPDVLNAYGIALADSGRLADARRQFERVLATDPENAKSLQNLGIVALRAGDREGARAFLMRALAINDRLPLALNTLGVIHAGGGDPARAIEAWSRAVELDPKQYDALYNLALVAGRSGRGDLARRALEQFVKTAPPERYGRELAEARAILARIGSG